MRARSFGIYRLTISLIMTLALLPVVASPALAQSSPGATPVASGTVVELAPPAITEATCDVGPAVTAPPNTDVIAYGDVTAVDNGDGTHTFSYSATVTAEGAVLPDVLPDGYARESDTVATYTITLPEADCEPEMRAQGSESIGIMAGGSESSCVGGYVCISVDVSAPDTIAPGATLTYTVTLGRTSNTGSNDTFHLDLPGANWGVDQNPGRACSVQDGAELMCWLSVLSNGPPVAHTYTVSRTVTEACGSIITSDGGYIANTPVLSIDSFSTTVVCPVSPDPPRIVNGECPKGAFESPRIFLPTTSGITYGYSPDPLPRNGTVTVTATLVGGHSWGDTAGWSVDGDVATRDFPVSSTECSPDLAVTKTVTAVNGQPASGPIAGLIQGDVAAYQILVENTGTAALAGLTISDPGVTDLTCDATLPVASFAPGGTVTCTATHTIDDTDLIAGSFTNTATASATYLEATVTDSDAATVTTVDAEAVITLEKSVDPVAVEAPGSVTYTFVIGNAGTLALNELSLIDDRVDLTALDCGGGALPASLAAGTSVTCTVSFDITQEMIDAGGTLVNEATVSAVATDQKTVDASSSASLAVIQHPAMTFAKTADVDTVAAVDDAIVYTFTIGNPGNVTLTGLTLTDALPGLSAITCDTADTTLPDALGTGMSVDCVATYSVTQDDLDAGGVTNAATASSDQTGAMNDAVTVTATQHPALTLEKMATTPEGEPVTIGTVITYEFTVTNSGTVTIEDIVVADALPGLVWDDANPDGAAGTLAPQESTTLLATYTVSDEDVAAGVVTNEAQASGTRIGCNDVVTLRQEDGDRCGVVSEVASVSIDVSAPPTATATATSTATATPTNTATATATATATPTKTATVAVSVLPATGHGAGPSGGHLGAVLLALAALLGVGALLTSRRWRHADR